MGDNMAENKWYERQRRHNQIPTDEVLGPDSYRDNSTKTFASPPVANRKSQVSLKKNPHYNQ